MRYASRKCCLGCTRLPAIEMSRSKIQSAHQLVSGPFRSPRGQQQNSVVKVVTFNIARVHAIVYLKVSTLIYLTTNHLHFVVRCPGHFKTMPLETCQLASNYLNVHTRYALAQFTYLDS
jgi:hypothetical protein